MKRVALVTGISGRFGSEFCLNYGDEYTIFGVCRGDKNPGCDYFMQSDVRFGFKEITKMVLKECGRVDLLINNAATYNIGNLDTLTPNQMLATLRTNVVAPYALIRELYLKFWKNNKDDNLKFNRHVVNMSSVSADEAYEGQVAYGPSKAALDQLNFHLIKQLKECGVRCNLVKPTAFPRIVSTEQVVQTVVELDRSNKHTESVYITEPHGKSSPSK